MNTTEVKLSLPERASLKSQEFFAWLLSDLELWICKHWPDTRPLKADRIEGVTYLDTRPWLVRNCANAITSIRLLTFWIVALGLFRSTNFSQRAWCIAGAIVLILSDGIDGELARGLGIESRFGKAFDPLADKLLIVSIAVSLVWKLADIYGIWVLPLAAITTATLFHEIALGITGAKVGVVSKRLNINPKGSVTAGKFKFALQAFAIVMGWLLFGIIGGIIATVSLCIAMHFSMQSRKSYIDQLHMLEQMEFDLERPDPLNDSHVA